jgi:hypothetical protein
MIEFRVRNSPIQSPRSRDYMDATAERESMKPSVFPVWSIGAWAFAAALLLSACAQPLTEKTHRSVALAPAPDAESGFRPLAMAAQQFQGIRNAAGTSVAESRGLHASGLPGGKLEQVAESFNGGPDQRSSLFIGRLFPPRLGLTNRTQSRQADCPSGG